ncbi:MAG: hypothetical protein EBR30_09055 [Cytophagia bacterium]|nr:hypothetical protein [Cytophagia bacterium]
MNKGNVSFNAFDGTIRKAGYLVPIDYYHEDLIDIVSFEEILDVVNADIPDIEKAYEADYDFDKALYLDINATDSYYEVTMDLWFESFPDALKVAEDLDIPSEEIYDIANECYIYDNEEED